MSIFSKVPIFVPKTNKIDLSHQSILTTSFGRLTPTSLEECLPGDVFKVSTEMFVRFQPLLAPIMDHCDVSMHYYFVPSRLCFEHFYKFLVDEEITDGMPAVIPFSNLDDLVMAAFLADHPDAEVGQYSVEKSLIDYLNIPTDFIVTVAEPTQGTKVITSTAPKIPVNIMPLIAYYLVWNKYYRDENLEDNTEYMSRLKTYIQYGGELQYLPEGDGDLLIELCRVRNRAYKKDYFTSALPWPQKGDDVLVPLGKEVVNIVTEGNQGDVQLDTSVNGKNFYVNDNGVQRNITLETPGNTTMTINDLRTSMRVQQLLENNARGGTRQQEFIKAHWGVYAKDARINDPEYIGGATVPVQVSEVLSQVANQEPGSSSLSNGLGQLGGHALSAGFATTKKYRVTEHGYFFGILSVRPKSSYFQGLPRMFSHLNMYDFFFPELSHLGEQEIKNQELKVISLGESDERTNDGTFGYTPRYAEYKYHANEVHGDFRSSLKYWHTARIFENLPGLNKDFISVNPQDQGQNRIFNYVDGDYDQILVQLYIHNPMLRKMPYYGIPKF